MGFLKFLKKKEGVELGEEELDLPPAPPAIGEKDLGLESLGEELPKPPELPELPEIEEEPEEKPLEEIEPEIPSFKPERFAPFEKMAEGAVKEERRHLDEIHEHKEIRKPFFIQLGRYNDVLDEIEIIKCHLNNFENVSLRLDDLKEDKDKQFTRWSEHLKDLQKKLIFVDKILF